jgi:hypothetical protein
MNIENLQQQLINIVNTKEAIKTAIEAKGVTVGDAAFRDYADKVALISGGSEFPPSTGTFVFKDDGITQEYKKINDFGGQFAFGGKYEAGERRHLITAEVLSGSHTNLFQYVVSTSSASAPFYWANGLTSGKVKFTFPEQIVLNGIAIGQSHATANGTWQLAGSNDDTTYTDIGDPFQWGGARVVINEFANTVAYKHYTLTQVGGTTSNGPNILKISFKTGF